SSRARGLNGASLARLVAVGAGRPPGPGSANGGSSSPEASALHWLRGRDCACSAGLGVEPSSSLSSGRRSSAPQAHPSHQVCLSGGGAERFEGGLDLQQPQPFVAILIRLLQPLERLVLVAGARTHFGNDRSRKIGRPDAFFPKFQTLLPIARRARLCIRLL